MKTPVTTWLLVAGLLFLPGCPQKSNWVRSNSADQQLERDKYECMQETGYREKPSGFNLRNISELLANASAGARNQPLPFQAQSQAASRDLFELCMKSRGYTR
jgi:hypothetical protein